MSQASFTIGDVFPADDPVSRFLTVIAMSTNDLTRLQILTLEHDEDGMRLLVVRVNAALLWEIATFIAESRRGSAEVAAFLGALSADAGALLEAAMRGIQGPDQTDFGKELAHLRNQVFHYPEIRSARVDREPLHQALTSAAPQTGSFGGSPVRNFRFGFADEVVVKLMSRTAKPTDDELADLVVEFATRTGAFRDFADRAIGEYLGQSGRSSNLRID